MWTNLEQKQPRVPEGTLLRVKHHPEGPTFLRKATGEMAQDGCVAGDDYDWRDQSGSNSTTWAYWQILTPSGGWHSKDDPQ
jgi:hypothetical protein